MHSKIQSHRTLDKYKNRGKACGLPVIKKLTSGFLAIENYYYSEAKRIYLHGSVTTLQKLE